MAGSAATSNLVEEKLTHLQLMQENENLKAQVYYIYLKNIYFCIYFFFQNIAFNFVGTRFE